MRRFCPPGQGPVIPQQASGNAAGLLDRARFDNFTIARAKVAETLSLVPCPGTTRSRAADASSWRYPSKGGNSAPGEFAATRLRTRLKWERTAAVRQFTLADKDIAAGGASPGAGLHIVTLPGHCGGKPHIVGHRIKCSMSLSGMSRRASVTMRSWRNIMG